MGLPLSPDVGGMAAAHPRFTYAYQPIVDVVARTVFSYEALIRGPSREPAFQVLESVPAADKYQFDQESRIVAITLAATLGIDCHLNLNFLPQGLFASEESISSTLA